MFLTSVPPLREGPTPRELYAQRRQIRVHKHNVRKSVFFYFRRPPPPQSAALWLGAYLLKAHSLGYWLRRYGHGSLPVAVTVASAPILAAAAPYALHVYPERGKRLTQYYAPHSPS